MHNPVLTISIIVGVTIVIAIIVTLMRRKNSK